MTINEVQDQIIADFTFLEEAGGDRYEYMVDIAKKFPPLPDDLKTEANLIKGCQSKVWVVSEFKDGRVHFRADSDSLIIKGIASLLIQVMSGRTPQEILQADLYFIDRVKLGQFLVMNRSNGLALMLKQMKLYALAWSARG